MQRSALVNKLIECGLKMAKNSRKLPRVASIRLCDSRHSLTSVVEIAGRQRNATTSKSRQHSPLRKISTACRRSPPSSLEHHANNKKSSRRDSICRSRQGSIIRRTTRRSQERIVSNSEKVVEFPHKEALMQRSVLVNKLIECGLKMAKNTRKLPRAASIRLRDSRHTFTSIGEVAGRQRNAVSSKSRQQSPLRKISTLCRRSPPSSLEHHANNKKSSRRDSTNRNRQGSIIRCMSRRSPDRFVSNSEKVIEFPHKEALMKRSALVNLLIECGLKMARNTRKLPRVASIRHYNGRHPSTSAAEVAGRRRDVVSSTSRQHSPLRKISTACRRSPSSSREHYDNNKRSSRHDSTSRSRQGSSTRHTSRRSPDRSSRTRIRRRSEGSAARQTPPKRRRSDALCHLPKISEARTIDEKQKIFQAILDRPGLAELVDHALATVNPYCHRIANEC